MLATLAIAAAVSTAAIPAAPTRWAEDHAGFVDRSTIAAIDAKLEAYQQATGHQVVLWIGKALDGAPLDDWAVRTFAAWKIGRKGIDDGVAIFVFSDDRKIDIEVGYGLEDKLPDAIASRIIREVMAPRLRAGEPDEALIAGVDSVLAQIEGKPWTGKVMKVPQQQPPSPVSLVIGGIIAVLAIILFIRHPRLALFALWSMWGRGGGFGGGGGGGFSGGGGRSGGGGARGGW